MHIARQRGAPHGQVHHVFRRHVVLGEQDVDMLEEGDLQIRVKVSVAFFRVTILGFKTTAPVAATQAAAALKRAQVMWGRERGGRPV